MSAPLKQLLTRLAANGLPLNTVYDVGAHVGLWSQWVQANVVPNARYILFEGNPAYNQHLQALSQRGFSFFNVLLSNPGRGEVVFYNGTNTGDSYYKETTRWYDHQGGVPCNTYTLDHLATTYQLPPPDLLKLDTQGSELDILAGAEGLLPHVSVILIECPIIEYNQGAPPMQAYLDFFKAHDFIPVNVAEIHVVEDTLLQLDLLFVRRDVKERYLSPNINIRV